MRAACGQAAAHRPIRRRRFRSGCNGFSLTELLMVIAIVGLLNGLTVAFTSNEGQRERVNVVALALAGWLEEVRSNALRETSADSSAGGCVVTISSLTSAASGATLASVAPSSCASTASLLIPGVQQSSDRYATAISNGPTITFTPRGSVTASSDAVVKILLSGSRQLRCVRVSAILGLVRIGSSSTASSSADSCTDYNQF